MTFLLSVHIRGKHLFRGKLLMRVCSKLIFYRYRRKHEDPSSLPILSSSCPGWICYAEKTHGDLLIPHISAVKSPQQITGSLVKDVLSKHCGVTPDRIYHVTVMQCYDKKLEASRQDFYDDIYSTKDVDLVLTAGEVEEMLKNATSSLTEILLTLAGTTSTGTRFVSSKYLIVMISLDCHVRIWIRDSVS